MARTERRPRSHQSRAAAILAEIPELAQGTSLVPNVPPGRSLIDFIRETGRKVEIANDSGQKESFTIVEGDLLLDDDQLQVWADERETLARAEHLGLQTDPRQLVGILRNGKILRWQDGLTLTYCVLRNTFPVAGQYQTIVENMQKATGDWSQTCGVTFEHKVALDDHPGTSVPAGDVRGAGHQHERAVHRLGVLPGRPARSPPGADRSVVLHDQLRQARGTAARAWPRPRLPSRAHPTRKPPACPNEPLFGVTNLTAYDPQSTMHYFCGGVGTRRSPSA